MILYLDTSALVKLYVIEAGTEQVIAAVEAAEVAATSAVTYAEARSALSRRLREGHLKRAQHQQLVAKLDEHWQSLAVIDVDPTLSQFAGGLAEGHGLRGFDAIHLASAVFVARKLERPAFFTYDHRLQLAAHAEGFDLVGG